MIFVIHRIERVERIDFECVSPGRDEGVRIESREKSEQGLFSVPQRKSSFGKHTHTRDSKFFLERKMFMK